MRNYAATILKNAEILCPLNLYMFMVVMINALGRSKWGGGGGGVLRIWTCFPMNIFQIVRIYLSCPMGPLKIGCIIYNVFQNA